MSQQHPVHSGVPLTMQIADQLKQEISNGTYLQGDKLPSESTLCQRFNTNRYTVRHALDRLVQAGLIRSRRGKGYFVNEKPLEIVYAVSLATRYSEIIRRSGHQPDAKLISCEQQTTNLEVQEALSLEPHERVYKLDILRFADDVPLSWSETWLPQKRFPQLNRYLTNFHSLYAIFQQEYGIYPKRQHSTFHSTFPTVQEMSYLQVSANTPLLQVSSVVCDSSQQSIEYTLAKFRGDLCRLRMQFEESES